MSMELRFPNPVACTGDMIFAMEKNHRLTEDMETQRMGMVDYLDVLNYMNGHSFDDPLQTRHAIAYMGMALPSIAYIDPHKTREAIYNLGLVCLNLGSPYLKMAVAPFNSNNVLLVEQCLSAVLYRLVSCSCEHDALAHETAEAIFDKIQKNFFIQHTPGIDTTQGRFEVLPNVMALLALELHDRFFGTRYSIVQKDVLAFIQNKLSDPDTGLYYQSYQTGSIGYTSEFINPRSAWRTNVLLPNINGLALAFLHYYLPEHCEKAWSHYKKLFLEDLLALGAEDVADTVGTSFQTQLAPGSEDLMAAMLCAREMGDEECFDILHSHILEIGEPHLWEGHLFFTKLGDLEHMIGHFMTFARVHVGWKKLMDHDWLATCKMDFKEVR